MTMSWRAPPPQISDSTCTHFTGNVHPWSNLSGNHRNLNLLWFSQGMEPHAQRWNPWVFSQVLCISPSAARPFTSWQIPRRLFRKELWCQCEWSRYVGAAMVKRNPSWCHQTWFTRRVHKGDSEVIFFWLESCIVLGLVKIGILTYICIPYIPPTWYPQTSANEQKYRVLPRSFIMNHMGVSKK